MNELIQWKTTEHGDTKKTADWFWALGIIGISIAVTAIILNNILFAVFILLGTFSLALLAHKKPEDVAVTIGRRGIQVDTLFYPYNNLDSFTLEDSPRGASLLLKSKGLLVPLLTLPISNDIDPDDVREHLLDHVNEGDLRDSKLYTLLDRVGF
jgi:hypothetical protein